MKTAEEFLKEEWGKDTTTYFDDVVKHHLGYAIRAINAARKEAIEESAMIAKEGSNDILKLIDDLK